LSEAYKICQKLTKVFTEEAILLKSNNLANTNPKIILFVKIVM